MQISASDFRDRLAAVARELPSAEERYETFRRFDPYPDIRPALLNAGHAASYVLATGMIDPFVIDDCVKPATYRVPLEGEVRYRDENNVIQSFVLTRHSERYDYRVRTQAAFTLKSNSICYVTLKPYFRIPDYIALRFNLTIKDVYRGLLVGTGPLVDPGFSGRLSIPIHNLTNNEYELLAEQPFVYFEFTKLSWTNPPTTVGAAWLKPPIDDQPPFPSTKSNRRTIDDYLDEATSSGPAESSITRYEKLLTQARNRLSFITIAATVAGVALIISCWQIYAAAQSFVLDARIDLETKVGRLKTEVDSLRAALK